MSARSADIVTTVSAAPRSRAPASTSSAPRRAASRPSATPRAARARFAQFSPRWGSIGRPAAIARVARSAAADAEPRFSTSSIASVASVVACSASAAGPPGSRSAAIVAVGLAPCRRRGGAQAQERDREPFACRRARREPLLGAAQDRRSVSGAAGEEEHAAELDRRHRDRCRIVGALDDLGQRGDRLRGARARVRLPELEQDGGAVGVGGWLVEGAGKQRRPAGGVAQGERVDGRHPAAG